MRAPLALALVLSALTFALAEPEDAEVVAARLGDDDPAVRDRAEHALLRMGTEAQAAVMNAAASNDPEVAARGKAILANLVWPEAGKAEGGLRLAVRAEKSYEAGKPVSLRVRLINTTDKDITVAGAQTPDPGEYMHLLLTLDGADDLHLCFRSAHPLPDLGEKFAVPANDWVEFAIYPDNWCAQQAHSKCCPVALAPGLHRLKLALSLPQDREGAWKGRVDSNEVKFTLEK